MKKIAIISATVGIVLAIGVLAIVLVVRSRRPEALLERLKRGRGNRDDLIMRLNVVRGDVVSLLIRAVNDPDAPVPFRADCLELLFKRNLRNPEPRIEEALRAAVKSDELTLRRAAAHGLAAYADERTQVALVDCLDDPVPEIRRQAYLVLGSGHWYDPVPDHGIWQLLSKEQKDRMIATCLRRMKSETDAELALLARAIVGREIALRCANAVRALQSSDVGGAEKTLRDAMSLDPANHQAQVRLVRFLLKHGEMAEARKVGREFGAIIEIPHLPKAPTIDGDPTDAVWAKGYTTDTFYHTTSMWVARRTKGKSRAYAGHRDGKIYIAILGYEDDLTRLERKHSSRDGSIWEDDCVELVFDPAVTGKDFYQIVINCIGAAMDTASKGGGKRNFKFQHKAAIFPDRGYWALEFAIDGSEFDNHPIKPGVIWALNLFRVRIGAASEHGGIWPLFGRTHRMDLYPLAVFGEPESVPAQPSGPVGGTQ